MQKLLFFLVLLILHSSQAADFQGWQGLRVLAQEGQVSNLTVIDVNGDGKESLFGINRRQSRIDIFSYVQKSDRKEVVLDPNRPNELTFLTDFKREEITLERPPISMQQANLDQDKTPELLVLTSNPLTLNRYDYQKSKWVKTQSWRLLEDKVQYIPFLVENNKAYFSFSKGILVQELVAGKTSNWMQPAEQNVERLKWWFTDIDKDGAKDLLELLVDNDDEIVFYWKKNVQGRYLPSMPLGEISGEMATIDESHGSLKFYFLNANRRNAVNSYELVQGEQNMYGQNRLLPLLSSNSRLRTSSVLENKKVLLEIDPVRPQMRVSTQLKNGFQKVVTFPVLRNVKAIASPIGQNKVLFHINNSAELYISNWKKGRYSFPQIFKQDDLKAKKQILGLKRQANIVWWVQSADDDLILYKWPKGADKPLKTVFKGIAKGLDRALWLGGDLLMVRKKYAKYSTFYTIKNGQPEEVAADHMKDALETQFLLFPQGEDVLVTRLVDGVLQLLGKDLQVQDQVMLSNGRSIRSCIFNEDGSILVLDQTGKKLHLLKADKSGVMRQQSSHEILYSTAIHQDPCLGLSLMTKTYVNIVNSGRPLKFKLMQTIDSKLGLPTGVKKATIHRFEILDLTGDTKKELVNFDYLRHQLTAIKTSSKKPTNLASWKVFDDGKYPYSDGRDNYANNRQPYNIKALDFDGDGVKELVLPCQDRIIIYMGRERK